MTIQSEAFESQSADNTHAYNPNQFGLSDLFALVTIASMLCVLFWPVARAMLDGQGASAFALLIIEFGLVAACGYMSPRRKSVEVIRSELIGTFKWTATQPCRFTDHPT